MRYVFLWGLLMAMFGLAACGATPAMRNNKANEYYGSGEYEIAIREYHIAQVEEPDNALIYFNTSNAYLRTERFEEARSALEQAILRGDAQTASQAQYNLGNIHFLLGDYEAAIYAYREALRFNPANEDARYNLELANMSRVQPSPTPIEMQTNPEEQDTDPSATPSPDPSGQNNPTPTPTPPPILPPDGPSPVYEGENDIGDEASDDAASTSVPHDGDLSVEDAERLLEPVDAHQERISTFRENYNMQGTPQSGKGW